VELIVALIFDAVDYQPHMLMLASWHRKQYAITTYIRNRPEWRPPDLRSCYQFYDSRRAYNASGSGDEVSHGCSGAFYGRGSSVSPSMWAGIKITRTTISKDGAVHSNATHTDPGAAGGGGGRKNRKKGAGRAG
jgi:hypothetical protein